MTLKTDHENALKISFTCLLWFEDETKVIMINKSTAFLKIVFFVKSFRRPYLRSSFDKLLQFYIQSYRYIINRAVLVYSATDAKSSKTFMKLTTEITGKG